MPGAATTKSPGPPPAKQLNSFLAKYTPEIAAFAAAARIRPRKQAPGGIEFVYDNYNALVIGYGTRRPGFFQAQPPGYRKKVIGIIMTAKKEETRLKRLEKLIADSAQGRRS